MTKAEIGPGKIKHLKEVIDSLECRKLLLVRGENSFKNFSAKIIDSICIEHSTFIVSKSRISVEYLKEGLEYYAENNFDSVLCVGGGSVIDMGKLISIFSSNRAPFTEYLDHNKKLNNRSNSLIAVPTTSGSGSEATHFAVLFKGSTKYSVANQSILPDFAIVDSELTYSVPKLQVAISGMDALCQGIESFWSPKADKESREFSRRSIKLIFENIENAVLTSDIDALKMMSEGSYYAGKAINIAKTTGAHALSYPLNYFFGIPHGHAVALSIPYFYELNGAENDSKNKVISKRMSELNTILGSDNCYEAAGILRQKIRKIGLNLKLPKIIVYDKEVSKIISNVNFERLNNNPVKIDEQSIKNIFKSLCH